MSGYREEERPKVSFSTMTYSSLSKTNIFHLKLLPSLILLLIIFSSRGELQFGTNCREKSLILWRRRRRRKQCAQHKQSNWFYYPTVAAALLVRRGRRLAVVVYMANKQAGRQSSSSEPGSSRQCQHLLSPLHFPADDAATADDAAPGGATKMPLAQDQSKKSYGRLQVNGNCYVPVSPTFCPFFLHCGFSNEIDPNSLQKVELFFLFQVEVSKSEIHETFKFFFDRLEERKSELLRELEGMYSSKQVAMSVYSQKAQETVDKIFQVRFGWFFYDFFFFDSLDILVFGIF
jgi:hypothetical protein